MILKNVRMLQDLYYWVMGANQIIKFSAGRSYKLPAKIVKEIVSKGYGYSIIKCNELFEK